MAKPASAPSSSRPGWMKVSPQEQREAIAEASMLSGKNRPPELWMKDGEEKVLRFRHDGPIAAIWRYTLKVGGRFEAFTRPEEGDVDLFATELGLNPTVKVIYEVVDLKGYVDRAGKKHRNVSRFLVANTAMHNSLDMIRRKRGGLSGFNISMSRQGSGRQTSYSFLPEESSPTPPEVKAAPSLRPEFERFYAPPSEGKQRAIIRRHGQSPDDEGDE